MFQTAFALSAAVNSIWPAVHGAGHSGRSDQGFFSIASRETLRTSIEEQNRVALISAGSARSEASIGEPSGEAGESTRAHFF
jgi:hypothetical protein